jgi:hypothetical protein
MSSTRPARSLSRAPTAAGSLSRARLPRGVPARGSSRACECVGQGSLEVRLTQLNLPAGPTESVVTALYREIDPCRCPGLLQNAVDTGFKLPFVSELLGLPRVTLFSHSFC